MRGPTVIEVIRLESTPEATLGVLKIQSKMFCVTLERPDLNNQKNISCIPEGVYLCQQINSPRFGKTYEVLNVPDRTHILFHIGNTIQNTTGCILLGQYVGKIGSERAILNSSNTHKSFLEKLSSVKTFALRIKAFQ